MGTSNEDLWQAQFKRRRQILKWMLLITLVVIALLILIWAYVTQPLISTPAKRFSVSVDSGRLEAHVRVLSEQLSPRDESHQENLDLVAGYIRQEFEKANGQVSEHPYEVRGKIYRNVIARFGPQTSEEVIVGAHYDAAGSQPGADDNASGVAGLIELAHLLGNTELPLRVELVAYTLEEPPNFRTPAMGSAVHAASLKRGGSRVRVMLGLEMIGYFSDASGSQGFPSSLLSFFYPSQGNFIAVVGNIGEGLLVRRIKKAMLGASALPVYSINAPASLPGIDFSDHLSYWNEGYPAVMITDTAFYRNHAYHTSGDTPERLDYKRMAMVVGGVYGAVVDLAQ
jgi:hypothetical protein